MQAFIESLAEFEDSLGLDLLTPELQILGYLLQNGPTPSIKLQGRIRMSPAGFHITKRRLREKGILVTMPSKTDARVALYDLSPDTRRQLLNSGRIEWSASASGKAEAAGDVAHA